MASAQFNINTEWLNTDWLNTALADLAGDNRLLDFRIEDIGDGKGYGGKTLRLHLAWRDASKLASVIVKLPVDDATSLEALRVQNMLLREVRFYRELASDIDLDIPEIYYTEIEDNDFIIVMEDLGDVTFRAKEPLNSQELRLALCSAAKLHAAFWNSPILEASWLRPIADGDDASRENNRQSLIHAIQLLEACPNETEYVRPCAHQLIELLPKAPKVTPLPSPVTLAHGDFHGNNLHIVGDDITIFDWQLVAKGTPMMDVANLITSSSEPEDYQKIVEPLLRTYHDALKQEGVKNYSYRKLQSGFSDAMFFTFLKFLMILGTINFDVEGGDEMRRDTIRKLNLLAKNADAAGYIKKLPFLFMIIRIINFFNRIGSWFKPSKVSA